MVRGLLSRRLTILLVVVSALIVGVVSLAGAGQASSAPVYTRTVVFTFSTTYALSVASAANSDVIAGVMGGNPAFSCLCRISDGEGTHVHPYEGGSPQVYDVEVDSAGQYIVAEVGPSSGAVAKISPTGTRTQIYSPGSGKTVLGVDVDADGGYIALVVDFAGTYQALVKIDAAGSVTATYPLPRESRGNGRVAVAADGNYVVVQAGDSPGSTYARLLKVNKSDGAVTTVYQFDKSAFPFGITVEASGDYLVTEAKNQTLCRITTSGQRQVLYTFTAGTNPYGIDIDAAGNILVAEVGTQCISRLTAPQTTTTVAPTTTTVAPTTTTIGGQPRFPDVPVSHPYYGAISAMAAQQVIGGYANGNFGPDDPVTRQQFAKMIVLGLGLTVSETDFPDPAVPFVDLGADDPAKLYPHEYVAVCARNNITKGTDATHFDPLANITRQQMITMIVRAVENLAGGLSAPPSDWVGVLFYSDPTHGPNIKKAEYNGLLDGIWASASVTGLAGWNTAGKATRGEVAQMLANVRE
jgi:streptogramin lyase